MHATILYGHSMSQRLLHDKIEMWHGDPDLYMNILEEVLGTPDDSDTGFFIEVDLRYPDIKEEKTKKIPICS